MGWVAHSSNTGAVLSNMKEKSIIAPRYKPEEDLRKVDFVIQLLSVHQLLKPAFDSKCTFSVNKNRSGVYI